MEYLKDRIIRLFITLFISSCICILYAMFSQGEKLGITMLVNGMFLGGVIWFVSEFATDLAEKIWPHQILPIYMVLSFVIIGGTVKGLLFYKVQSMFLIVIISAIAEILGLLILIFTRRMYKRKLNKHLKEYKTKSVEES